MIIPESALLKSKEPMVTAAGLIALQPFLNARGLDWRQSLEEVGLDPDSPVDVDTMIPFAVGLKLLENLARQSGNDAFGLQFAESLPTNVTGTLAYLTLNAPDLRTMFKDTIRFLGLVVDAYTVRLDEGEELTHLTYQIPQVYGPRAQFVDLLLVTTALRIRHVLQDPLVPIHVEFEHPTPSAAREFIRLLGRHVQFDRPHNRIGVETRYLSRPLPAADPLLYQIMRQHARETIVRRERATDIVYCVSDYVAEALKRGEATLGGAADRLGMPPRRLQRELEDAGTSFRELVEETRKGLARHFLLDTSMPMTEIAFLLGFSELSAFSRAARSWFGTAPRELRKSTVARRPASVASAPEQN